MSDFVTKAGPSSIPGALLGRLSDVLVCPGQVFDEVIQTPHRFTNWAVPLILVCLSSLLLSTATLPGLPAEEKSGVATGDDKSATEELVTASPSKLAAATGMCMAVGVGTVWSALVIWFLGRFPLKVTFGFSKALEVVGLSQMVLVLGAVTTLLLIYASGDSAARPAVSFFIRGLPADSPARVFLDTLNVFHLWSGWVLAIGLSRLSGVSTKEAAFWVLGYWVVLRSALLLLG